MEAAPYTQILVRRSNYLGVGNGNSLINKLVLIAPNDEYYTFKLETVSKEVMQTSNIYK